MLLSKPIRQICQRKLIRSHRLKGRGKKREERRKKGRKGGKKEGKREGNHQHRRFFLWIKIIRKKWVASILHEMEVIAASHGVFLILFWSHQNCTKQFLAQMEFWEYIHTVIKTYV